MYRCISASLMGILILVYITTRISHGHEITRQRRDVLDDQDKNDVSVGTDQDDTDLEDKDVTDNDDTNLNVTNKDNTDLEDADDEENCEADHDRQKTKKKMKKVNMKKEGPKKPKKSGRKNKGPKKSKKNKGSDIPKKSDKKNKSSDKPKKLDKKNEDSDKPKKSDNKDDVSDKPKKLKKKNEGSEKPKKSDKNKKDSTKPKDSDKNNEVSDKLTNSDGKSQSSDQLMNSGGKRKVSDKLKKSDKTNEVSETPRKSDGNEDNSPEISSITLSAHQLARHRRDNGKNRNGRIKDESIRKPKKKSNKKGKKSKKSKKGKRKRTKKPRKKIGKGQDSNLFGEWNVPTRNNYYVYRNGKARRHRSKKPKHTSVDETVEIKKQKDKRLEKIQKIVDKFLKKYPEVKVPDISIFADLSNKEINEILKGLLNEQSRKKRFVTSNENYRWTGGIVPYVVDPAVSDELLQAITSAQTALEKNTCGKFVPWVENETKAQYNLNHDGYLNFVLDAGCWSYVGNLDWPAQPISCCGQKYVCIHEIGHAFGIGHEHQSPESDVWTRVNWDNVMKSRYESYKQYRTGTQISFNHYDTTSALHYATTAFSEGGRVTWTSLFPELGHGQNNYYAYFDISVSHDCRGLYCSDFQTTCLNDGYTSVLDGECTCMCPYGLERSTGCTTTITEDPTDPTWPGGNYALLATVDGCPSNGGFSEGEVTHWSDDGSWHSFSFHLRGDYGVESTNMHFCVMDNGTASATWPPGVYCIQSYGGSCPDGFEEGYIQFDNVIRSESQNNSNSGTLPDGIYDIDTLFYYCCRDDGFIEEIMDVPNEEPFALLMYGDECQSVRGMMYVQEFYYFANLVDSEFAETVGAHPTVYVGPNNEFATLFCYYTPLQMNCGGAHELSSENPSVVITTPNFPDPYSSATECNWLITAPEGSTILLNFDEFDVEQTDEICYDYVEIRHALLGQSGNQYCGNGFDNSIRSILNTTSITFRSDLSENWGGFKLTASVVLPEEHCYDTSDLGKTYRGTVNFTRNMEPCLHWSEVTQCPFHALDGRYFNDGLDYNYCRNPGKGVRPWCYTSYDPNEGCIRNYCDACLKETIYDGLDDCAAQTADGSFCQNSDSFSSCANTCITSLSELPAITKVSDVSCNAPTIPSDGLLVSTPKISYNVGETIEVQCNSSSDTVTATCLTDGSWNLGNYVCGVCPTGWSPYNGYCYKHFAERLTYANSKARCAEYGGIIAPTNSLEELQFVVSLRTFMKEWLWLGADDLATEGTWLWQDGSETTWFNWMDGQPDNATETTDCAYIAKEIKDNKWKNLMCHFYNEFVCRVEVSERTSCIDRRDNCEDIFNHNPSSCVDYPDFANQECPYTCGLCSAPSDSCVVPLAFGAEVTSSHTVGGTVNSGELLTYVCLPDYVQESGDLVRGCSMDGELTGEAPVCAYKEFADTSLNDVEIIGRALVGENSRVYTGPMAQFLIPKEGEICQWTIHSKYSGMVSLQIWRPQANNSYQFIGQNVLVTGENTASTFDIYKTHRIPVEVNDVIGIYYPGVDEGGVSYDFCSGSEGMAMKSLDAYDDVTDFIEGDVYAFDNATLDCRLFSINAVISPRETYVESNDVVIKVGDRKGEDRKMYTGTISDLYVPVDGVIAGWNYHSLRAGNVSFQVWRRNSNTNYTLIGQNFVSVGEGILTEAIAVPGRIRVEKGDYLGIYYHLNRGQVSMFNCRDPSEGIAVISQAYYDYQYVALGLTYAFGPNLICKRFNMKAIIQADEPSYTESSDIIITPGLVNGVDRRVFTGSISDLYIPKAGTIIAWHYHSLSAGDVAFQVWRRISDTNYTFVGQNWVTVNEGIQTVEIGEGDRISVERGDFIGVYYGQNGGQVTMDDCDDPSEGIVVQSAAAYDHTDFTVGTAYGFGPELSCQRFNVKATIAVKEDVYVESNDVVIRPGRRRGIRRKVFTGSISDLYIPTGGQIVQWQYHSRKAGRVAFQVWERKSHRRYKFVGQNWVKVGVGIQNITVAEPDRITVKQGQFIGVYYGRRRGQVTMHNCKHRSEGIVVRSRASYNHDDFKVGKKYAFGPALICKRFNVKAIIKVN